MRLVQLKADNFRSFQTLSLPITGRLNFFYGANAAGKTTLLESLYCLSRGKSFRGSSPQELAGAAGRHWSLFARFERQDQAPDQVGLGWTTEGSEIRLNGQAATTLDLVQRFPVQILEPGMHRMLQDGPTYRRGFLDWGVFHVEHGFMESWRRYRRALRQRNQALRRQAPDRELSVWEPELSETGQQLHAYREQHLSAIGPAVAAKIVALLGSEGAWSFDLHPGWSGEDGLAAALARHRDRDRRMGMTLDGPHRAELRIRAGDHAIRNRISRGQQKLLIAALLLAQCDLIHARTGAAPLLLVDDFSAELAAAFQRSLYGQLQAYPGQILITGFEPTGLFDDLEAGAMFHVEHGQIRPISRRV
ncbi:MAG TPA: DNA replication/repair protein RecF [Solimonas sp.]